MAKKRKKALGNSAASTVTKEIAKSVLPKIIIGGMAIGAGYFLLIKPILTAVGVMKTDEEKKNAVVTTTNQTSLDSPFSPRYWKSFVGQSVTLLTKASVESMVNILHDAIGNVTDDENKVYGVFRQLKAKTQVSQLSEVFYSKYQEDLYNYLSRNLNSNEIGVVNTIVNGLAAK